MRSLLDVLRDLNIDFRTEGHHHCSDGWAQIECPYCPAGNNFRMGVNLQGGYCNCWTCGGHNLLTTLLAITGMHYRDLQDMIAFLPTHYTNPNNGRANRVTILPGGTHPLYKIHTQYLIKRGFDPDEIVNLWRLEGTTQNSEIPWRLIIPIIHQDSVCSWTSRSISQNSGGAKYVNAARNQERISRKELLYGLDYVRNSVVVVEGPTDVWRIGPGAVATMGLAYSKEQVLKLSRIPQRIICFDNEPQAQEQAKRLVKDLEPFPGETIRVVLSGKDPDSSPPKEIAKLRKRYLDCSGVKGR